MTRSRGAIGRVVVLVMWLALVSWPAACGGGSSHEQRRPETAAPSGDDSGGGEMVTESDPVTTCEQAVRCCYAFVAALTENRPEDQQTCRDLERTPDPGEGAGDSCAEMVASWNGQLVRAQRDAAACQ